MDSLKCSLNDFVCVVNNVDYFFLVCDFCKAEPKAVRPTPVPDGDLARALHELAPASDPDQCFWVSKPTVGGAIGDHADEGDWAKEYVHHRAGAQTGRPRPIVCCFQCALYEARAKGKNYPVREFTASVLPPVYSMPSVTMVKTDLERIQCLLEFEFGMHLTHKRQFTYEGAEYDIEGDWKTGCQCYSSKLGLSHGSRNRCFGTVKYVGGNIYHGHLRFGEPHGFGEYFEARTSRKRRGMWFEGGFGGTRFTGTWVISGTRTLSKVRPYDCYEHLQVLYYPETRRSSVDIVLLSD